MTILPPRTLSPSAPPPPPSLAKTQPTHEALAALDELRQADRSRPYDLEARINRPKSRSLPPPLPLQQRAGVRPAVHSTLRSAPPKRQESVPPSVAYSTPAVNLTHEHRASSLSQRLWPLAFGHATLSAKSAEQETLLRSETVRVESVVVPVSSATATEPAAAPAQPAAADAEPARIAAGLTTTDPAAPVAAPMDSEAPNPPGAEEDPAVAAVATPFDPAAARAALDARIPMARACVPAASEKALVPVEATFAPSGRVTQVIIKDGSLKGTEIGGCVARALRGANVPAYAGDKTVVTRTFSVGKAEAPQP